MDKLDIKQKILLAIYTEYQKDLPIMKNVNFNALGIEKDIFIVEIQKLQNEIKLTEFFLQKEAGV